jgi:Protein of unknown function (DUF3631)
LALHDLAIVHGTLLTSKQVEQLVADDESDWANYRGRGAINKFEIAQLLKPYGIAPTVIHPRGRAADRGYDISRPEFEIAFKHYLGKSLPEGRTVVRKRPGKSR